MCNGGNGEMQVIRNGEVYSVTTLASQSSDHSSRSHTTDPQSLSLSHRRVSALPSANAARGRGEMGTASWGVWPGCDRARGDAALSTAAQCPTDP